MRNDTTKKSTEILILIVLAFLELNLDWRFLLRKAFFLYFDKGEYDSQMSMILKYILAPSLHFNEE